MDRSRIETHIKPLLGARLVSGLQFRDIEGMQADIAAGTVLPFDRDELPKDDLGSGLIDQSQKTTAAAMRIAEK